MLSLRGDLRVLKILDTEKIGESPRTASTDGGSLLGNTGKPLETGVILEVSLYFQTQQCCW
jgi:hypothetical protein